LHRSAKTSSRGTELRIPTSNDPDDFSSFIKNYLTSAYVGVANTRLQTIERAAQREAVRQKAEEARQKAEQEAAAKIAEEERQRIAAGIAQQADAEALRRRMEQLAALQRAEREAKFAEEARLKAEREAALKVAEEEKQRKAAEARERELREPTAAPKPEKPQLPSFPWPPPAPSASYVLPQTLLGSRSTVGEETADTIAALEQNGYVERSFYSTPGAGGVALITRLERIQDDGSSATANQRWAGENQRDSANLINFLLGLLYADPGRYRVIVFMIQDEPFAPSPDKTITGAQARKLLSGGANVLPPQVSQRSAKASHCTALVYEFENDGSALRKVESSRLTGMEHLEKAGLLAALKKPK
jgi:hypothetical protein